MGKLKGIVQFTGSFNGLSFMSSMVKLLYEKQVDLMARKLRTVLIMLVLEKIALSLRIVLKWGSILDWQ